MFKLQYIYTVYSIYNVHCTVYNVNALSFKHLVKDELLAATKMLSRIPLYSPKKRLFNFSGWAIFHIHFWIIIPSMHNWFIQNLHCFILQERVSFTAMWVQYGLGLKLNLKSVWDNLQSKFKYSTMLTSIQISFKSWLINELDKRKQETASDITLIKAR